MIRLIFKITHLKPLSAKPCIKFLEEIYGRFICIMLVLKKKVDILTQLPISLEFPLAEFLNKCCVLPRYRKGGTKICLYIYQTHKLHPESSTNIGLGQNKYT